MNLTIDLPPVLAQRLKDLAEKTTIHGLFNRKLLKSI